MSVRSILLMLLVIAGVGAASMGIFFRDASGLAFMQNGKVIFPKAVIYWRQQIKAVGPNAAYQEMVKDGDAEHDPGSGHVLAHSFGGALYDELGPTSLAYCQDDFLGGCYHQVIGAGIAEYGPAEATVFAQSCVAGISGAENTATRSGECFHGLGHGILASFGYTFDDLEKALVLCDNITASSSQNARIDCRTGTFMEYNLREMVADNVDFHSSARPFSESARYAPCFQVQNEQISDCVFQLPYWWIATSPVKDLDTTFQTAGTYCRGLSDASLQKTCFRGIGYVVPWYSKFSESKTMELCTKAAGQGKDLDDCLYLAAEIFESNNVSISQAFKSRYDPTDSALLEVGDFPS